MAVFIPQSIAVRKVLETVASLLKEHHKRQFVLKLYFMTFFLQRLVHFHFQFSYFKQNNCHSGTFGIGKSFTICQPCLQAYKVLFWKNYDKGDIYFSASNMRINTSANVASKNVETISCNTRYKYVLYVGELCFEVNHSCVVVVELCLLSYN